MSEWSPAIYLSPVPPNTSGMAPVTEADGDQTGPVRPLPTFDELAGTH